MNQKGAISMSENSEDERKIKLILNKEENVYKKIKDKIKQTKQNIEIKDREIEKKYKKFSLLL